MRDPVAQRPPQKAARYTHGQFQSLPGSTRASRSPLRGSRKLRVLGQHVRRQPVLAPQVIVDILVTPAAPATGSTCNRSASAPQNRAASARGRAHQFILVRGEAIQGYAPDRLAIRAPV